MIPSSQCPCCGRSVGDAAALRWNALSRTLSGRGKAVVLSPHRALIFDALWKAWPTGRMYSLDQIMTVLYADDPNGGPDSENIVSVQINHTRKALAPFGLNITGRHGYSLVLMGNEATA